MKMSPRAKALLGALASGLMALCRRVRRWGYPEAEEQPSASLDGLEMRTSDQAPDVRGLERWTKAGAFGSPCSRLDAAWSGPFCVPLPTLGQAVAMMGFSESFASDSILTIYSHYFGHPTPAALVMGLPVAYPAEFLIRGGMHAADAYAAMAAVWLSLAFVGAFLFARLFGAKAEFSALMALLWMSMPVVWAHASYSSLSFGIALMPLYLFLACRIFAIPEGAAGKAGTVHYLLFVVACITSAFMDGYSFMMFAVAASFIGVYAFIRSRRLRRHLLVSALPVHLAGFGFAALLYVSYVGGSLFEPAVLDHFRGWGVDLTFLAAPTQGMQWLWDGLHLSVPRSADQFFGDASVWQTTFSLPLIVVGLVSWWRLRSRSRLAHAFVILAVLGLWLAMGPSVKIDSTKPEPMGVLMPANLAIAPTGNAFLDENIPGFNDMRATYRWSALMIFSLLGAGGRLQRYAAGAPQQAHYGSGPGGIGGFESTSPREQVVLRCQQS